MKKYTTGIETWFMENRSKFPYSDVAGKVYVTKIWNKKNRPQRIYIIQNYFGVRKTIGFYKLPQHYFVHQPDKEVTLSDELKEMLMDMVV